MYNEYEIKPIPLSVAYCRRQVESFLESNELRLEDVDYYACVYRLGNDDEILAGGGLKGDVIKCVAVGSELRDEGFSARLISHLISEAQTHGYQSVKTFTKPANRSIFESMGLHTIATAQNAILLESGNALRTYCSYLESIRHEGRNGVIIMNANPFTRGHQHLIETAARQVDWLYVIVVQEDNGSQTNFHFPYKERKRMIESGTKHLHNVIVAEGSSFQISAATFPTYFLKQRTDATDTHIALDLDIFTRYIATSLNANVRFVGSEPNDELTARYNQVMHSTLPQHGIEVVEIERLCHTVHISASAVRRSLSDHSLSEAGAIVPATTMPYLVASLASDALQRELDLTPKPGLVDKENSGSHNDMDYALMSRSIKVLRPYFADIALLDISRHDYIQKIQQIGIDAETEMLNATKGINTHRGALFAMGVTIGAYLLSNTGNKEGIKHIADKEQSLSNAISLIANQMRGDESKCSHGSIVAQKYGIGGALSQARQGYTELFNKWLPFYRAHKAEDDGMHKTLLYIMSMLQDTNIYYRVGADVAGNIRQDASRLLANYSNDAMRLMNKSFTEQAISPGGSADMLALTIFVDAICS